MCILFVYVANYAKQAPDGPEKVPTYKLIVATNRDEKYSRPLKPADFWETTDSHILAGRDLEELGSWLGISKQGRFAIVLNVMGAHPPPSGRSQPQTFQTSRGSLVTGFLRSPPGLAGWTYCNSLCHDPVNLDIRRVYKPFHLITIDLRSHITTFENDYNANTESDSDNSTICVTYLSNRTSNTEEEFASAQYMTPQINTSQYYAIGNSIFDMPFRKVESSREEFIEVVEKFVGKKASETNDAELVEQLLDFLRSKEKFYPDDVIKEHAVATAIPTQILRNLSSRFVEVPNIDYGTRTQTIILVDTENNVTFHEWTLGEPTDPLDPIWFESMHKFKLSPPN